MAAIDVTPAGNQLYQVHISDGSGSSDHELTVPDSLIERWDLDDVSVQEVVLAATELLVARDGRTALDARLDLDEVATSDPGLVARIPERARERSTERSTPTHLHRTDPDQPSGDERLLEEVKQEQREGSVDAPREIR